VILEEVMPGMHLPSAETVSEISCRSAAANCFFVEGVII
jgi:hypothetical protein